MIVYMLGRPSSMTYVLYSLAHKIGIISDIEKAFLHIYLEGRNYTHFVWLSQPTDPESEFLIYHFKVVLFGSVSSPFMLNAPLLKLMALT